MESAADKVFLDGEGLQVHTDSLIIKVWILNVIVSVVFLSFTFKCKSFSVVQFGILGSNLNRSIIILMSFLKLLWFPVEIDVSSVENNSGIIRIKINSLVKIGFGFF